jgi:hypothetical protein
MGRKGSGLIWYSKLQGGSPCLCRLRPASVEPRWTSIWTVLTDMGHMESPNWVASCVEELDDTLPHFIDVQWDSVQATHGVSTEAYTWKIALGRGKTQPGFLVMSWIVATHGALRAYVCHVVRCIPLQGWLLIQISMTPSNMGDGLFDVFKCSNSTFIMLLIPWDGCRLLGSRRDG